MPTYRREVNIVNYTKKARLKYQVSKKPSIVEKKNRAGVTMTLLKESPCDVSVGVVVGVFLRENFVSVL